MIEIPVDDIMEHAVRTISLNATVNEAAQELYEREIGSLIVVDGNEPVGIVTKSDINMVVAQGRTPREVIVGEIMSEPLVTIGRRDSIRDAADRMCENSIKKLAVVDEDGDLVGVIAAVDLACYLPTYRERIHSRKPESKETSDR